MNNAQRAATYAWLMKEIKFRLETIDNIIDGTINMQARTAEESCYLQFRMTCETLALGCLIIHGDQPALQTGKLKSKYRADEIIKSLEAIHDKFYPIPVVDIVEQGSKITADKKSDFLTKSDLLALYHRSGDKLHRGTLKNLFEKPVSKSSFDHIRERRDKIVRLLNKHRIVLGDGKTSVGFGWRMPSTRRGAGGDERASGHYLGGALSLLSAATTRRRSSGLPATILRRSPASRPPSRC